MKYPTPEKISLEKYSSRVRYNVVPGMKVFLSLPGKKFTSLFSGKSKKQKLNGVLTIALGVGIACFGAYVIYNRLRRSR